MAAPQNDRLHGSEILPLNPFASRGRASLRRSVNPYLHSFVKPLPSGQVEKADEQSVIATWQRRKAPGIQNILARQPARGGTRSVGRNSVRLRHDTPRFVFNVNEGY